MRLNGVPALIVFAGAKTLTIARLIRKSINAVAVRHQACPQINTVDTKIQLIQANKDSCIAIPAH